MSLEPSRDKTSQSWLSFVKNSNWNALSFIVAVFANFLALPYVVQNIGIADFGAGGIFIGALAPLMLVGTVIGQACVRELSLLFKAGDFGAASSLFWTGIWLCGVGSVLVVILFCAIAPWFIKAFMNIELGSDSSIFELCTIAVVGWSAQQVLSVLQAGIVSTQAFRPLAFLNAVSAILAAVCLITITTSWQSVAGFLVGTATGFALSAALSFWYLYRYVPNLFPVRQIDRNSLCKIRAFGGWQSVSQLFGAVALQSDRFLLGAAASMSVVGQFNVATRLQEVVYMGILKITEVLFPHFSAQAGEPVQERVPLLLGSSWLTNSIAAAALAPMAPLATSAIGLWIGAEAVPYGGLILRTLVTAGLVGCGTNALFYFMLGQGIGAKLAKINIAHCMIVVAVSSALILTVGPIAAGVGFLVANVIRLAFLVMQMPRLTGRVMTVYEMAVATQVPILIGVLVAWAPWPDHFTNATTWGKLFFQYSVVAFVTLISCVLFGSLVKESRLFVVNIIDALLHRLSRLW